MLEQDIQPIELLYEGKSKSIYTTADPSMVLAVYRDDMTAFNGAKHDIIENKGKLNARACEFFMTMLEEAGARTHFIRMVSEASMLVRKLHMIPLEVIVRNIAAGSLVARYPFVEGQPLEPPIVVFDYKSDERGDPMITPEIIFALDIVTAEELEQIRNAALQVNTILKGFFDQVGITLADFKLEFGRDNGVIYLGDEISMDSMRLWDKKTKKSLDKDVYRQGSGDVIQAYTTLLDRILPPKR